MAGYWIKMRIGLRDDPSVVSIAAQLNLNEDMVVGKLHRLWSWADLHTVNGTVPGITPAWIDRYVERRGFSDAMAAAGWVSFDSDGIHFPHFDRHNGESAKRRAEDAERKRNVRNSADKTRTYCGHSADKLRTRGEEIREEKNKEEKTNTSAAPAAKRFVPPTVEEVADHCRTRNNSVDAEAFVAFYASKGWKVGGESMKDWKAAVITWEKRGSGKAAPSKPDPMAKLLANQAAKGAS